MNLDDAPHEHRPDDVRRAEILTELLGQFVPGTCIDLGTGAGWFARISADLGWQVTAIDARDRGWAPHPGVGWRQQDVRDVANLHDHYDLVLCLGLFYHLTLEDQMSLLAKCAGIPLILDTHVALPNLENKAPLTLSCRDGYLGGLYFEGLFDASSGTLASWGNAQSFWPTEKSQERMLQACGYTSVIPYEPWWAADRTFWVCLP